MRGRVAAIGLGTLLGAQVLWAQPVPIPNPYAPPPAPAQPRTLPPLGATTPPLSAPPGVGVPGPPTGLVRPPTEAAQPQGPAPKPVVTEIPLPQPEQKVPFNALDVSVKRVVGGWEVWAGQKSLRSTGENEGNARDMARVLRELRPTEWVVIGGSKPVVEYGLTNGRPAVTGAAAPDAKDGVVAQAGGALPQAGAGAATAAKLVRPIDIRTARVEPVRGAWVVRDDQNILLNFGPDRASAEQAGAVIQRYGFNRLGVVGDPARPTMSYFFASLDPVKPDPAAALMLQSQIEGLTRTGIPVPGVGYTGELVKIDPRKLDVRKDGVEWVVAFGPEVLGRFGPTEWAAREAARTIQDARFTEFCKLGGASGLTFFLVDGKPPTRAPFSAQGRNFDLNSLKVQQANGKWYVAEAGRQLFEVGSTQEGEMVVRVLKAYGFDQTATLSAGGAKGGISYLVKNARR